MTICQEIILQEHRTLLSTVIPKLEKHVGQINCKHLADYSGGENEGIDRFGYGSTNDFNPDIYISCVPGPSSFPIRNIHSVYKKNN